MRRFHDFAATKNISVYVVMKGARHVATVRVHHGGTCFVEVCNFGKGPDTVQTGSASGGGYDKFTAALSGLVIDGATMTDHCTKGRKGAKDVFGANYNLETRDYSDWYILPGLDRLKARGYRVVTAV
ncbi:hypothetical protein T8K17_11345 [Thalassobaculum sp. OXR-137]|uniref:hypothetical protein n=1 Tax=Thalassobaculum sp. OXR-137 TaxID=3100173 RepID=UPI002AC98E98|nr:hypothetical protein [Thalassobaculum sp. OXR-137]WPZ36729.1 hypothetical protein T8K17_11345 [Thalassobaculum sp. OXR-137]